MQAEKEKKIPTYYERLDTEIDTLLRHVNFHNMCSEQRYFAYAL